MPKKFTTQIESTVPSGTAPLIVASPTLVNNLNAQYLNGVLGSGYATSSAPTLAGLVTITGNDNSLYLSGTPTTTPTATKGLLQIGTLSFQDKNILANFQYSVNDYAQVVFQNTNSGTGASMDIVINNDTGGASANYADLGINSSTSNAGGVWDDANGTYLYANGGSLTVGTQGGQALKFATGNTLRASIDSNGTFTIPTNSSGTVNALTLSGTPSAVAVSRGMLQVGTTLPAGNADSNILASFAANAAGYSQVIVQNSNNGANASADFIVSNDSSTPSNLYGDFGINSSGYTGSGPFNAANSVYLYSVGADIAIGTRSVNSTILATNDVARLTIADASSTFTNRIVAFTASNTTAAPLTLPHLSAGTAPGTLVNGDLWTTTSGLFARINGATVGPFSAGGVSLSANNAFTGQNTFSQVQTFTYSTVANSAVPALYLSGTPKIGGVLNVSTGLLQVGPVNTTLQDTNIVGVFNVPANDYSQTIFINAFGDGINSNSASVDICLYNDQTLVKGGLGSYADIGLSSSTYSLNSSWPAFSDPGGMYIYMQGGSLTIGTQHVGDSTTQNPTSYTNDFGIATDDLRRVTLQGGRLNAVSNWIFESNLNSVIVNTTLISNNLRTAATTATSTNSSAITIQSGNATGTTSSSGTVTVDTGTGTTAAGTISIGTTNAPTVTIGRITGSGNTTAGSATLYPAAGGVTATGSYAAGYIGMPQMLNPQTTNAYTFVATDAGKHIYLTTGTNNALTIPANGTTAFPIGTTIVVVNKSGTAATVAITTDTLTFAGTGTAGQRTIANFGIATLLKVTATEWFISGNGIT